MPPEALSAPVLEQAVEGTERPKDRLEFIDGLTSSKRRKEIQRRFNTDPAKDPLRILLATDAAREGLNFQAHCTERGDGAPSLAGERQSTMVACSVSPRVTQARAGEELRWPAGGVRAWPVVSGRGRKCPEVSGSGRAHPWRSRESGRLLFRNAGVLFFAREPRRFFNQAYVTCLLFKGTAKVSVLDRKDFAGGVVADIEDSMRFIERNTRLAYRIERLRREEIPEYPPSALREAITNAIMHRDWFIEGANVFVEISAGRIEVSSPGGSSYRTSLRRVGLAPP